MFCLEIVSSFRSDFENTGIGGGKNRVTLYTVRARRSCVQLNKNKKRHEVFAWHQYVSGHGKY